MSAVLAGGGAQPTCGMCETPMPPACVPFCICHVLQWGPDFHSEPLILVQSLPVTYNTATLVHPEPLCAQLCVAL